MKKDVPFRLVILFAAAGAIVAGVLSAVRAPLWEWVAGGVLVTIGAWLVQRSVRKITT